MRTLTLNNKSILFGMLIVTLGFSKSWFQTADASNKFDLASSTNNIKRNAEVDGEDYSFEVTLTTREVEVLDVTNGAVGTRKVNITEASYNDNGCTSCITNNQLTSISDTADLMKQIDEHYKKEKKKLVRKNKEEKELEEAIANCEKAKDGDKIIDLEDEKNSKLYYRCKAKKVKSENPDRKERREAFQREIVDDLQLRLLESNSEAERRDILASIKEIKKEIGSDSGLKTDLSFLEKGAKALSSIPALAQELAILKSELKQNPSDPRLQAEVRLKMSEIDNISMNFNTKNNPRLRMYSEDTRAIIQDWSSEVAPLALRAIKSPEQITREFFDNYTGGDGLSPGVGIDNGTFSASGSRSQRVDMGGMQYIPRYLDPNTAQQQQQNTQMIDPNTGRPYIQNGQQMNPNFSSRFQQNNGQRINPNMPQRGGIPQMGQR